MQTTDFLIHIEETLDRSLLESVEGDIRQSKGVLSAGHRADKPHLVQVVYDSDTGTMAGIMGDVRHHGLHAQAIGL